MVAPGEEPRTYARTLFSLEKGSWERNQLPIRVGTADFLFAELGLLSDVQNRMICPSEGITRWGHGPAKAAHRVPFYFLPSPRSSMKTRKPKIGRPCLSTSGPATGRVSFRLDAQLLSRFTRLCHSQGRSRNQIFRELVKKFLSQTP